MKRILIILCVLALAVSLAACGGGSGASGGSVSGPSGGGEAQAGEPSQDKPAAEQPPAGPSRVMPSAADFDAALDGVTTRIEGTQIIQTGTADGTEFSFTIDLSRWNGHTSAPQIVTISQLFWECYPQMYARFGQVSDPPKDVILLIEDEGYEIAETWDCYVHLHDRWLEEWPTDYDCLTHEFAHVIQNGWSGETLEYDSYIERFADCCRYEYAFHDGYFNDECWTLWPVGGEPDRESSVRFLVWLDSEYSTPDNDLLLNYFRVCFGEKYPSDQWDAAWAEIFAGSALAGKSIGEVWDLYAGSEFAALSAEASEGGTSALLETYDVPGR